MSLQKNDNKKENKEQLSCLKGVNNIKAAIDLCKKYNRDRDPGRKILWIGKEGILSSKRDAKDLMKQLEIETDEANEVDEKEFRALLDELKKKMRAEEIRKMNKKRKATA